MKRTVFPLFSALLFSVLLCPLLSRAQSYDLLLQGGHVIDPANGIDKVMDVAVSGSKIAAVAAGIPAAKAKKVVDVSGLYVTPGLVDIHVHVYAGTGMKGAYSGDSSV